MGPSNGGDGSHLGGRTTDVRQAAITVNPGGHSQAGLLLSNRPALICVSFTSALAHQPLAVAQARRGQVGGAWGLTVPAPTEGDFDLVPETRDKRENREIKALRRKDTSHRWRGTTETDIKETHKQQRVQREDGAISRIKADMLPGLFLRSLT